MKPADELKNLINGTKPMASYNRAEHDLEYHEPLLFEEYCKRGDILRSTFVIKNKCQRFRVVYDLYAPPDQAWRFDVYRKIKEVGQNRWNVDLEKIESILLGY